MIQGDNVATESETDTVLGRAVVKLIDFGRQQFGKSECLECGATMLFCRRDGPSRVRGDRERSNERKRR